MDFSIAAPSQCKSGPGENVLQKLERKISNIRAQGGKYKKLRERKYSFAYLQKHASSSNIPELIFKLCWAKMCFYVHHFFAFCNYDTNSNKSLRKDKVCCKPGKYPQFENRDKIYKKRYHHCCKLAFYEFSWACFDQTTTALCGYPPQ